MVLLPIRDSFPRFPASWYLFCRSRDLARRPISRDMLGRRLVAYRTANGQVTVLDARCSHLGADLGRGSVIGECVRCPFHHWQYGADGKCTHIPNVTSIPAFAAQERYPTQERHGYVFFFNGAEPLFPLPFFFDCQPEEFVAAGRPFRFIAECAWYMLAANGFDGEHFRAVHDRTLLGPGEVDCPAPYARRMRYRARVTGSSVFDRMIRRGAGDLVDVSITSWAGPLILVTGSFARARSYILIAAHPLNSSQTHVDVVVLAPRGTMLASFFGPLSLWVRGRLTRAFMQDDIDRLGGIEYNPASLIETDHELIEYFRWAAALPHWSGGRNLSGKNNFSRDNCFANGAFYKEQSCEGTGQHSWWPGSALRLRQ